MDLYLVRHAIAERRDPERWPDDAQRPLTQDGVERFRAVARGLRRIGVAVEAVLASSYVRAWRTAEILAEEAAWPSAEVFPALEPSSPASECAALLSARGESSLALVGHQPQLSQLVSLLLTASEDAVRSELKKGGVVGLRFQDAPQAGAATLGWSASAKMLRLLDR